MDKRTIMAVVLSVLIISASFVIQMVFFPSTVSQQHPAPAPAASAPASTPVQGGGAAPTAATPIGTLTIAPAALAEAPVKDVTISTGVFDAVFSTKGAVLTSLKLKAYNETNGKPVDMVLSGDTGLNPFRLYLDSYDTGNDVFEQKMSVQGDRVDFSRPYVIPRGGKDTTVVVTKSFKFLRNEYMMEFRVAIDSPSREPIPIEVYRFAFGPQIGPVFKKLDNNAEYRHLVYFANGKRQDKTGKVGQKQYTIDERATWAAVEGKYFLVAGISYVSDANAARTGFDASPLAGLPDRHQHSLTFARTIGRNLSLDEGYKFYIGPKKHDILQRYTDKEKNEWRESGLHLEEAATPSIWGWLSDGLKWVMEMLYKVIPNWGVAIILLTVIIKLAFWPLTHKSFESTSKMQALGPKLEELKAKHKDNPQRLNQEMAALYKKEGVNPLGGCLPMLLQMPIFFALYYLFYNYFELRGAAFIPGWIPDLSAPERFLSLPFSIPFLGDTLNLLPFIMTGMTFLQQLVTQTPGTQSAGQMKLLLYGMPLFFFFIMYNMPSGLLLYWTVQSLLSFVQQFHINRLRARSQAGTGDKR
jgi:YidC/Oxa1 family membrane protein insertase